MTASEQEKQNARDLRRHLSQGFLKMKNRTMDSMFLQLRQEALDQGLTWQPNVALELWWDLVRAGYLCYSPRGLTNISALSFPNWILTSRGEETLKQGANSPHDTSHYLIKVRHSLGQENLIVENYASEAASSWKAGNYRSSVVMLGCATESLVIELAEAIAKSPLHPWAGRLKKKLNHTKDAGPVGISAFFEDIRESLLAAGHDGNIKRNLVEALDRKLTPIFEFSRGLRNNAGHPTSKLVTHDEAHAALLLFPTFCATVTEFASAVSALENTPD